jgi:hypothetical protein
MDAMNSSLAALNALNFFMADVQGGLGPFSACSCKHASGRRHRLALS